MQQIRALIRAAAPGAVEHFSSASRPSSSTASRWSGTRPSSTTPASTRSRPALVRDHKLDRLRLRNVEGHDPAAAVRAAAGGAGETSGQGARRGSARPRLTYREGTQQTRGVGRCYRHERVSAASPAFIPGLPDDRGGQHRPARVSRRGDLRHGGRLGVARGALRRRARGVASPTRRPLPDLQLGPARPGARDGPRQLPRRHGRVRSHRRPIRKTPRPSSTRPCSSRCSRPPRSTTTWARSSSTISASRRSTPWCTSGRTGGRSRFGHAGTAVGNRRVAGAGSAAVIECIACRIDVDALYADAGASPRP